MDKGAEMKDTALDLDWKNKRFKMGASVPRYTAAVVLGLAGGSAVLPRLLWWLLK